MTTQGTVDPFRSTGDSPVLLGFKAHLQPTPLEDGTAYLVSKHSVTALRGPGARVLVPLLDGTRSQGAVLRDAAPDLSPDQTSAALRQLDRSGLLRWSDHPAPDRAAEAYWELAGLDGPCAVERLSRSSIRIVATGRTDPAQARIACLASGLSVVEHGADLTLVLCEDYLTPELGELDLEHRADGIPWLPARLCGVEPWIGPVFRPDGGCWSCLASRLRHHRRSEQPLLRALGIPGPVLRPPAALPPTEALAVHSAVLEAVKWLAGLRYPGQAAIRILDTRELRTRSHPVPRLPQCATCGDIGLVAAQVRAPIAPQSRLKAADDGGGHRALTPEQMLETYRHLIDPVTGIADEIQRAPRAPKFVHVYLSGHNLAFGGPGAGLRRVSGGKGLTAIEAQVGALCEAVERYSGTRFGDEPVVRDTFRALGPDAVHPNSCQLYHRRQFRSRKRHNASGSPFQYVPQVFDEDRPVDWTPVWSLTARRHRLLPTSMLYFSPDLPSAEALRADSNGNAAGGSLEDAILQGFLELVERDAAALWWYNRTPQPGVDLAAFGDAYLQPLLDGYRSLRREVWVLDLTTDFGIPVMAALSRRIDKAAEDVIFGFGCHLDPRLALRRALTELGQMLPAVAEVQPDGSGYGLSTSEPLDWWRTARTGDLPYLVPAPDIRACAPADWAHERREDLGEDIAFITEAVAGRGMELLVLDQTRPDLGLPVVKVLVPGLRHFWARYAPGRLYDVPVALGRLARPTAYEELNPVPLFV